MKKITKEKTGAPDKKQSRVSQSDIPRYSLEKAIGVAKVISDDYGGGETAPHRVAEALAMSPTSSSWQILSGSAVAYGLTEGAYNAKTIKLTDLGKKIVSPTEEGLDEKLKIEAALKPRISKTFFGKYNRSKFPREEIGANVLADLGVPRDRTKEVLQILKSNGEYVGIITNSKTGPYVATDDISKPIDSLQTLQSEDEVMGVTEKTVIESPEETVAPTTSYGPTRVFITHGKNKEVVLQLKDLLTFGKFAPVVAEEHETTSKPVPEKVMTDMRSCQAGIIHIESEEELLDQTGNSHRKINENVLIEIGAAMALYKEKIVLLVQKGVRLPSNLQGLYRCEYVGNKLDYEATMKLLKIFNDFR